MFTNSVNRHIYFITRPSIDSKIRYSHGRTGCSTSVGHTMVVYSSDDGVYILIQ